MPTTVLTTSASITCLHPPGRVLPPPPAQTVLFIKGEPALTAANLVSMSIVGCADSYTPCTKVAQLAESKKLFVQGEPVLLAGAGKALPTGGSVRASGTASALFA
ncbi:hypothetical protein ACFY12_08490 [Streptomyces sp. NPDC001339]|uniref:hypothetical protein n=1 Tax=Streptomyces sp. NPDC001339 TaxID=3364563 RepID=UPI0036C8B2E9